MSRKQKKRKIIMSRIIKSSHTIREQLSPAISPKARGSHRSIGLFIVQTPNFTDEEDIINYFKNNSIDSNIFIEEYNTSITDKTKERVMAYMKSVREEEAKTGKIAFRNIKSNYKTIRAVHTLENAVRENKTLTPAEEHIIILAHFPENFENMVLRQYEPLETLKEQILFKKAIHEYTMEFITERVLNPEKYNTEYHKKTKKNNVQNTNKSNNSEHSKELCDKMKAILEKRSANRCR